jgi:deoxycytidylate deaminase
VPDGRRRAYVLDSLRHPAEVFLLRNLYQTAFTTIGVVCNEDARVDRLTSKFSNAGKDDARNYMKRDAKADARHGQRVEDTFHLSDYFVDNSANRTVKKNAPNPDWTLPDQLFRLIKIVTHSEVVRPNTGETAMYAASGAQRRSACLSRQVGAALVDSKGNLIAVGTNEVPCAGGGVYGQGFSGNAMDERCAHREDESKRLCSNTREQARIIDELIQVVREAARMNELPHDLLAEQLRRSAIGGLIEFSRAVHAEMDALLSAGREGRATVGTRMYVTTFPCHFCARHIVAAGVDEVQYVESYPKSKALLLHEDSITPEPHGWKPPSQGGTTVLFRPFTGVAPRLYARAFLKDRDLKDDKTGKFRIGEPHWGSPWDLARVSYTQLEAELNEE